jgi:Ni,Fe-hydrogenase I cytochrome b subunit
MLMQCMCVVISSSYVKSYKICQQQVNSLTEQMFSPKYRHEVHFQNGLTLTICLTTTIAMLAIRNYATADQTVKIKIQTS